MGLFFNSLCAILISVLKKFGGTELIDRNKYLEIVKADYDGDISAYGDIVINQGIFVRGNVFAASGSVFIEPGAIVQGRVEAGINIYIGKKAIIIGRVKAFHVENKGEIKGDVHKVNFYRCFGGTSTGNIEASAVLIGEYGIHRGPINSICTKIDEQGRHFKE